MPSSPTAGNASFAAGSCCARRPGRTRRNGARSGGAITLTLGTEGAALRDGLQSLTDYLAAAMARAEA